MILYRLLHPLKHSALLLLLLFLPAINLTLSANSPAVEPPVDPENPYPFQIFGVLEGFYGEPWSHEERLDMIRFTSNFGMQSYLYAPKDDPYHRARWRDPYSGDHLLRFEEMMRVANEVNVEIWYAISPGLDMVYSSEEDYQALMSKMEAMIALGVRNVALFVDDVPESLIHDADREQFDSLAEAHVHVGNRLHSDLSRRGIRLALCPTTYTNAWGDRAYIHTLGEQLDPDIPIFWTGTDVVTGQITAEEAIEWGEILRRPPLIWDNYPVNDFDTNRLFLGPLEGRDGRLANYTLGILSNPMNQPYASMIPLATLSYYVADPEAYEPDAALERALRELYPEEAIPHVRKIVNLYREGVWKDHRFAPVYRPGLPGHVETIEQSLADFETHLTILQKMEGKPAHLEGFVREVAPFLMKTRADWQRLKEDPSFYVDEDGMLRMRLDQQVLLARRAPHPVDVDGDLDEWEFEGFYSLQPRIRTDQRSPEVALLYDDNHLYLAIRVYRDGELSLPDRFYSGDHLAAIFDLNPDSGNFWVEPRDPVILMRPYTTENAQQDFTLSEDPESYRDPGTMMGEMEIRSLHMTDYTRIGFSNNPGFTFSWFYLNQAGAPLLEETLQFAEEVHYAWQLTEYGYSVELAVPHLNQRVLRATIGGRVTTEEPESERRSNTFILSRRPFLGNTATYPVIRLID